VQRLDGEQHRRQRQGGIKSVVLKLVVDCHPRGRDGFLAGDGYARRTDSGTGVRLRGAVAAQATVISFPALPGNEEKRSTLPFNNRWASCRPSRYPEAVFACSCGVLASATYFSSSRRPLNNVRVFVLRVVLSPIIAARSKSCTSGSLRVIGQPRHPAPERAQTQLPLSSRIANGR
jgi:hypothetical protein